MMHYAIKKPVFGGEVMCQIAINIVYFIIINNIRKI